MSQIKLALQAQHDWLTSVADAVVDHAGALDEAASQDVLMKGKLAVMERELEKGLVNCEKNLTDAFSKVDALIGQLRAESTSTTAALAARTAQLEAGLANLPSSSPLGLQPPPPPGIGGGALDTTVQLLSQQVALQGQQQAQHEVQLRHLKTCGTIYESGISEVAGRVLALEEYCKSRPMGPEQGNTQATGESFDPWQAAAAARGSSTPATLGASAPGWSAPVGQSRAVGLSTSSWARPRANPWNVHPTIPTGGLTRSWLRCRAYQYDSKDTASWLKKVKNYFIGQCPDSKLLIDWAEQQGNEEIAQSTVRALAGSLCLDADPVASFSGDVELASTAAPWHGHP